jgi:hypothetical protein
MMNSHIKYKFTTSGEGRWTRLLVPFCMIVLAGCSTYVQAEYIPVEKPEDVTLGSENPMVDSVDSGLFLSSFNDIIPDGWTVYGIEQLVKTSRITWKKEDSWLDAVYSITDENPVNIEIKWEEKRIHITSLVDINSTPLELVHVNSLATRLNLENQNYPVTQKIMSTLIIKKGVMLRDAINDISILRKNNAYYDLQNVQYTYSTNTDQAYTFTSLTDINQALNTHYQLDGENSVYLHENESRLIVTNKRYNGQLYVFDVQETNLFENLVRLTAHYDWTIEPWPLPYHYLIETPYPMIIDSLEDGLRKLLSHFPLQAQALHNTRNILLAPRTKAIKSGISDE